MNYNCRRTLFLAMACLLCVAGYAGASMRELPPARPRTEGLLV